MKDFQGTKFLHRPHNRVHPQTFCQDVRGDELKLKCGMEAKKQMVMRGYLNKRSCNFFKTWNRRWFIIQNNQLMYLNKSQMETVMMEHLHLCTAKPYKSFARRFCFQVLSPTKKCVLQADSEEKREAWIRFIQNINAKTHEDTDNDSEELETESSSSSETLESISLIQQDTESSGSVEILNPISITSQVNELNESDLDKMSESSGEFLKSIPIPSYFNKMMDLPQFNIVNELEMDTSSSSSGETLKSIPIPSHYNKVHVIHLQPNQHKILHTVAKETPRKRSSSPSKGNYHNRYIVGNILGKGGFGYVFEGVCKMDGKQVAIKVVKKTRYDRFVTIPGERKRLPVEVALMFMVSEPTGCDYIVELLEWFDTPESYILILERPDHCTNLYEYRRTTALAEPLVHKIMWQVVLAARHCCDRGVFHRDIKEENLLVCMDTIEVKLIDFGCGDLLKSEPYRNYSGTMLYAPPEWFTEGKCYGCPSTVWSLGVLLFILVCGQKPFYNEWDIIYGDLCFKPFVSKSCRNLIRSCLMKDPKKRLSLEMILKHSWF